LVSYSGNFHAFFWHNSCNLFLYIAEVDDGSSFLRESVTSCLLRMRSECFQC
jgi:hypothetical protein